ncbi:FkbM family methyltransferase [Jejudonia soesokkakensis]|uniref:FkbM family methyltransferase n=1 Tax=Jejudonia soesokkakensis TaxID=1323432 RepID=A0ABW2MU67_9FLAO
MKYYFLSTVTRILLGKLRKYHKGEPQLLVFSRDFIGEEVFAYGVYEKHDIATIINSLDFDTRKHVILDIGANIGNHTLQFSKHFKKVFSFEPNPLVFEVLKLNTRNLSNVILHPFGLSNTSQILNLQVPEDNIGGGGITTKEDDSTQKIKVKRGDDVIFEDFSIMKIDIEGHELEAIIGFENAIKKQKPIICFEFINNSNKALKLIEKLKNLGYSNFYMTNQPKLLGFSVNSFTFQLLAQLFSRKTNELIPLKKIDKKFYNLIIAENPSSANRINKKKIINS